MLEIRPLAGMCFANIFTWPAGYPFNSLIVSCDTESFLILMKSAYLFFSLFIHSSGVLSQKILSNLSSWNLPSAFLLRVLRS